MADTLTAYTPTLRDRLRYYMMGDDPHSTRAYVVNKMLEKGGLLDYTPLGIPLNAYDAGRSGASGDYVNSLLSGAAALPAAGPAIAKGISTIRGGGRMVEEAAPSVTPGLFSPGRIQQDHDLMMAQITKDAQAAVDAAHNPNRRVEDVIGPRIDQLGTPSKTPSAEPGTATNEFWGGKTQPAQPGTITQKPNIPPETLGLPHFMTDQDVTPPANENRTLPARLTTAQSDGTLPAGSSVEDLQMKELKDRVAIRLGGTKTPGVPFFRSGP